MAAAQTLDEALVLLRKQQVEMERLHAAHEAWMRAVSHDLRAPLRHVISFAPLLRESVQELALAAPQAQEAAQDAQEFAQTMEGAARKMSAMLDGMAQVSRAARSPLNMALVDVAELLAQLVQARRARHPAVHWTLPVQAVPVLADTDLLRAALEVVVDNAVKFSARQAQPVVNISAEPLPSGWWRLVVQDNGVGFDAARASVQGVLFQRMHRDSEFEGVGCGLALLRTVAERHGAQWQLQAQPQAGCRVSLEWPGAA